ncbi:DNA-binding transcriptional regulator YbjK [Streptosporangium becharense]|uniref:DNA-binding transcriptional regulator YbjK n=1 Tax=Streptosporangium becharense TaxID=1816182 RepID=A0A7W9INC9_9ACTN|nr:TetR family transcriptional regulator C-terminal domain-containing protein [Streptosporangium becharense]MBB2914418.1 DNA-binding transcriptional regulator YbjK [Streptosporangium becharense]MBB5823550.1 DNA-binding transcriptional regulator YbjK [Streptosporangium becharense]
MTAEKTAGTPPAPPGRRFDPGRRDRIIDVTLDVIAAHGVAGASHRRIAEAADVPLGSMTYHFAGMGELLVLAFTRLADRVADRFDTRLAAAGDPGEAGEAVVALITEDLSGSPRDVVLTCELYTLAARDPALREVTRTWMARSRRALERHFDVPTARYLDALIEGLALHRALDPDPMDADDVRAAVRRIISA